MMKLTFENWNYPLGIVRVTVDKFANATWSREGRKESLLLSAEDADGEPVPVFVKLSLGSSTLAVDGTANDWNSAIPCWMQTDALSAAFDEFCKGDQTSVQTPTPSSEPR